VRRDCLTRDSKSYAKRLTSRMDGRMKHSLLNKDDMIMSRLV
jgi:hypothetical protein